VLDLFGCRLGDEGVSALARSPVLENVRRLNVANNHVSDVGARALAGSPYLSQLEPNGLTVQYNLLTPAGLALLSERFGADRIIPRFTA
jgi:hypothetical protein